MSTTTVTNFDPRVAAKITDRKAAAAREIAELREAITDPAHRAGSLVDFTKLLQREVAFLNTLQEIEFGFAEIDDCAATEHDALVQQMLILVSIAANAAENNSLSHHEAKGQAAAANSIARTIADVSRDLAKGREL